jgi:hypothetical protein
LENFAPTVKGSIAGSYGGMVDVSLLVATADVSALFFSEVVADGLQLIRNKTEINTKK